MLAHFAHVEGIGASGVRLFFVLSGFLITRVLLKSKANIDSKISTFGNEIKKFYLRRSIRIFPIYYLVLFVAFVRNVKPARETFPWHFFYMSNVHGFVEGWSCGMLGHFWSLSVEEQFYLFLPFLILLLPQEVLLYVLSSLVLVAPLFRAVAQHFGWCGYYIWLLPSQLDGLGFGALLALFGISQYRSGCFRVFRLPQWIVWYCGTFSLGCFVWLNLKGPLPVAICNNVNMVFEGVFFTWLVGQAAYGFYGIWGGFLNSPAICYIGKISYGIYVYHTFANFLAHKPLRVFSISYPSSVWLSLPIEVGTSIACAAISWHLLENPLNALKSRLN